MSIQCTISSLIIIINIVYLFILFALTSHWILVFHPLRFLTSIFGQIYIVFYHVLFFMLIYSYWQSIVTPPGYPSKNWYPEGKSKEELDEIVDNIMEQRKNSNNHFKPPSHIRYCVTCNIFKPPRTHHCRHCKKCILKQDHHCPWIANCVGYQNQKPFLLFLFYTTVVGTISTVFLVFSAFYVLNVSIQNAEDPTPVTINNNNNNNKDIILSTSEEQQQHQDLEFLVSGPMVTVLYILNFSTIIPVLLGVSGLFYFQSGFIFSNLTSVERYERKSEYKIAKRNGVGEEYRWRYDRGPRNNFKDVFGDTFRQWICPVGSPRGDGINWKLNNQQQQQSEQLV
ncbi:Hypothetical zinc finger membrane protein [Heterostelium album PN500]|uniref:Palmitoyltransferase n=1 Tax=Heterostelium pallidum (strain ATCC 26659 / Pp 5 / PN500) TaxID=670386 RepID=D3B8Q0_HETP5|nr:Hypothetical zinc finger membrane protein [Heterostelium album PN500]EFA82418.1 Hypothetical zinc finger membrane protein [Heterostelium album PN500]|eukprot:XP_020434535.1 Hypothetical zinc finger membrane protein [Heterostelium album PN500]